MFSLSIIDVLNLSIHLSAQRKHLQQSDLINSQINLLLIKADSLFKGRCILDSTFSFPQIRVCLHYFCPWARMKMSSTKLAASPCGDCDSGEKLRLKDQVGSVNLSALIGPSAIIMSSVRFTYISLSDCHMFICVCVCVCVCLIPSGTESIYCK